MVDKRPDDMDTRLFDDESLAAYMESRYAAVDKVEDELAMRRDWLALRARITDDAKQGGYAHGSQRSRRFAAALLVAAVAALFCLWPWHVQEPEVTSMKSGAPAHAINLSVSRINGSGQRQAVHDGEVIPTGPVSVMIEARAGAPLEWPLHLAVLGSFGHEVPQRVFSQVAKSQPTEGPLVTTVLTQTEKGPADVKLCVMLANDLALLHEMIEKAKEHWAILQDEQCLTFKTAPQAD